MQAKHEVNSLKICGALRYLKFVKACLQIIYHSTITAYHIYFPLSQDEIACNKSTLCNIQAFISCNKE